MGLLLAVAAACMAAVSAAAAGESDLATPVAAAIAKLGGHPESVLRSREYDTLDQSLDAARKILYENGEVAVPAIRGVLENEREDSFLIIDLANVLAVMESDPASLTLTASAIERADVQLHPGGTVRALAWMASRQCEACLPAVFRVLELSAPRTTIAERGLSLNRDDVLIFTLGQYGDASLPGLLAALTSGNCAVRANAARSLRWVRPDVVPTVLRDMARADFCAMARSEAWHVLGEIDDPELPDLARRRLDADPPPDAHERLLIADGLVASHVAAALEVLDSMRDDHSPEVQSLVRIALDPKREPGGTMAAVRARARNPVPPVERARRIEALEKGAREGRFRMEEQIEVFATSLTVDDIPLVDRTRASILRQLSDESRVSYIRLTEAVRAMRMLRDTVHVDVPR